MNDLALAWTDAKIGLPAPLRLQKQGPLQLITAPAQHAETPRQRLTFLQACFDAGIDLLPLATHQRIIAPQATPPTSDLLDDVARLRGQGQLTLTLAWQAGPRTARPDSGQRWLQMRQGLRAEAALAEQMLEKLARCLPFDRSLPRTGAGQCTLDLLVPRAKLDHAHQEIAILTQTLATKSLPGASLLVTGLWPVFSFVRNPRDSRVPA